MRRGPLRSNHTATHILNYSLRAALGDVVDQKGSLVSPEKLRFDYSCKSAPKPEQLTQVEEITNKFIKKNMKVYTMDVPLVKAKEIMGLRAIFGEVYPDPVRVVSVGYSVSDLLENPTLDRDTSIEFCGGTHVSATTDIKRFVIVEDTALAKGIRRLTGVTGEEATKLQINAKEYYAKLEVLKRIQGSALEAALKELGKDIDNATIPLLSKNELRTLFAAVKKEFDDAEKLRKTAEAKDAVEQVKSYFESHPEAQYYIAIISQTGNSKALSSAMTQVKSMSKAALLVSIDGEKASIAAAVPKTFSENGWSAQEWAKVVIDGVGGKVGGSQSAAQGSGPSKGLNDGIELAELFAKKLSFK